MRKLECGKNENQTLNQDKGEITVSLNRGYLPFAMEKDGKIFGLDVDLANLLTYEYFEQMSWARQKTMPEEKLNRAQLLKNRFVTRKKAEIDRRRREFMGRTACNVTGDMAVTCIVAKTEDEMDSSYWKKEDKPSGQLIESLAD